MRIILNKLFKNQDAQGLLEYGLIISFISILLIASLIALRVEVINIYENDIVDKLP